MKHYLNGGSTADRTDNCHAWKQLSAGIPNIESEAAKNGTAIHKMLEDNVLIDDYDIAQRLGRECPETGLTITLEMVELAQEMWTAAEALMDRYNCEFLEAETTGEYDDETGSTVDMVFAGHSPEGKPVTVLLDYKSGRGKQVEAVGNAQLLHNAWCLQANSEASDMFDDAEMIVAAIIQPDRGGNVQTREWAFTKKMVVEFSDRHLIAIEKSKQPGVQPVAGSWCSFCPAEATCPAKTGDAQRALLRTPDNLELLAQNMALVELLKPWISSVEKAVYGSLELGAEVEGWKLVNKLARESWKDEQAAIRALRRKAGGKRAIVVEKLLTPAQARKVLKAAGHEVDLIEMGLTEKKSSGTTIAPESDKREAVLSAEAFGHALASVS